MMKRWFLILKKLPMLYGKKKIPKIRRFKYYKEKSVTSF